MASAPTVAVMAPTRRSLIERGTALFLIVALLMVNLAIINLRVANFPVRAAGAVLLLGAAAVIYPGVLWASIRQHALLLWLSFGLAVLGGFVSMVYGTPFGRIWQGIMETSIQVAVTLIVVTVLAKIAGFRASAFAVVAVIAASVAVAALQFVGFEPAWTFREWLGSLQNEPAFTPLINRRPMGFSYSPIQLSTQICVAFAVYAAAREYGRRQAMERVSADPMILAALGFLVVGSIVTLTRSPILGAAIFFLVYAVRRPGSWLLFLGLLGILVLYLIGPLLLDAVQENAPRVVRTNDDSAAARISMNTFGILLFADNPLGYGYAFKPSDHFTKFWQFLYNTPHPSAVQDKELHNYVLSMLNTYGVGLLLLVPLVVALLRRGSHMIIFFVPFIVHIIFHNSGPFWNDIPFWFGIAALSATPAADAVRVNPTRRRRWHSPPPAVSTGSTG